MAQGPKQKASVCFPENLSPPRVQFVGKLQTGMMAIGGETTGVQFKTKEGSIFELAFADQSLQKKISGLGSTADIEVSGWHVIIPGVEIAQRSVIIVAGAVPASKAKP